ncbi:hypothetical protein PVAND_000977 [Polypedilum vanderplanki]|nr:hypothetical protein PVAND_000977 [Polypedilum vanderplanki]
MFEDLLDIMKSNGLQIPRNSENFFDKKFDVIKMNFGNYLNIGIERAIKSYYKPSFIRKPMALVTSSDECFQQQQPLDTLLIDVAVYIVKSKFQNGSTVPQCMIIFGRINCQVFDDPFIIGVYYGSFPTPTIGNEIMKPFVDEMKSLSTRELVLEGNYAFEVKINAFVCDPISNSLITCTSLPNSLYGCSKCNQRANLQIDDGFASFPCTMTLATPRSDDDFKYLLNNVHHAAQPILMDLNIGLISQFVIDYKIIVCKGVMKHLMNLWMRGRLDYRLNKETQQKISRDLILMSSNVPREFLKKPRSLDEISQWDSSDWNEFLLYYSPIALKSRMPQRYYVHFLYLHLAMRILMSSDSNNSEANSFILGQLLNTFIADFTTLYGSDKLDFNVHNLLHFEQIQQKLGPLKKLNGFIYEDQINMFNSIIDANENVNLEEIGEKLIENSNTMIENKVNELINTTYPFINSKGELVFKKFTISILEPDNHMMTRDSIIKVEAICSDQKTGEIFIIGKRYEKIEIMFQAPLSNQKLYLVSNLSTLHTFRLDDIICKAVKIDNKDGIFVQPLISFDALNAQLSSELSSLKQEFSDTDRELRKLEEKWKDLKTDQERLEKLLEKAKTENDGNRNGNSTTLRETLSMQLREQENTYARLKNQISHLQMTKEDRRKQIELWNDLAELFDLKIKCFVEQKQKGIGGTMQVTSGSETFTLQ